MNSVRRLARVFLLWLHRRSLAINWRIRCQYYSLLLSADRVRINGRIRLICPENLFLGRSVSINEGCIINAAGRVHIGDRSHISPGVIINSGALMIDDVPPEQRSHRYAEVIIENDVWVASGAIINPGVRIGRGAVVAAGAVVTSDIPPESIAMGIPARVVRRTSADSMIRQAEIKG